MSYCYSNPVRYEFAFDEGISSYELDPNYFHKSLCPEEKLLLNILYRAVQDLFKGNKRDKNHARLWFEGRAPKPCFTCQYILEILEINPCFIKELLSIAADDARLKSAMGARKSFSSL